MNRIPQRTLNIRQAWNAQVGGWLRFRLLLVCQPPGRQILGDLLRLPLQGWVHQRSQISRMLCLLVRRSTCFWCERHFKQAIFGDLPEFEWGPHLELKEPFVFDCMDECFATCVGLRKGVNFANAIEPRMHHQRIMLVGNLPGDMSISATANAFVCTRIHLLVAGCGNGFPTFCCRGRRFDFSCCTRVLQRVFINSGIRKKNNHDARECIVVPHRQTCVHQA